MTETPEMPEPKSPGATKTDPPASPPPEAPSTALIIGAIALLIAAVGGVGGFILGGRTGAGRPGATSQPDGQARAEFYTCGMHPWVILPEPGLCPICHMDLTQLDPDKLSDQITIDPRVIQRIGVRIEPVTQGPLVSTIRTVGTVDYDETGVRDINIKVHGWIERLHVDFLGAEVAEGDPLFDLYSPELYAAQEEYLLALRATSNQALLDAARTRLEFFDISPKHIEALAESGKPSKTMTIDSPWQGVVIAKHANEGMRVDPGMQVYRIADLSKVWVMVTVYEYQIPYVKEGQEAVMTLSYIPGQTFEGRVSYVYPYLDRTTRQLSLRLEFDNPDGLLKPGMYAKVELRSTLASQRTLAPRSAVIDTGERQVAFVSLGEGRFEPRDLRVGVETEGGMIEILDGLRPGEMIVTSGQFLLDSESHMREALAKMVRGTLATDQEAVVATTAPSAVASLPPDLERGIATLLDEYFAIGGKLADDSIDQIAQHARAIASGIDQLLTIEVSQDPGFWQSHDKAARMIRGEALALVGVEDIEDAREYFADLSIGLDKLVKATGVPPSYGREVHELLCPMYRDDQGGSIWLQPAGEVRNPFMGSFMPTCHSERHALPVTGAVEADGP